MMKNKLIQIFDSTKIKGLIRSLQCSHKDVYEFILKYQSDHKLETVIESIYCIINDIIERPKCKKFNSKCLNESVIFKLDENKNGGFLEYCSKCLHAYKTSESRKLSEADPIKKDQIEQNRIQNCLIKYGVESHNQLNSVKKKKKETLFNHFGEDGLKHKDIHQKRIDTSQKNYGTNHPLQNPEILQKQIDTNLEVRGVSNVMKDIIVVQKLKLGWKLKQNEMLRKYIEKTKSYSGFDIIEESYNHSHDIIKLKCKTCSTMIERLWNSFQQGGAVCEKCFPQYSGRSSQENDVYEFIKNHFPDLEIITNNQKILSDRKELDIYIPSKKIAIEYCGLWRHSSGGNAPSYVNENYHLNKLEKCNELGIRLITIFEDEWVFKEEIVKSILLKSLGFSEKIIKLRAENLTIKEIDYSIKRDFINKYHLQGDRSSHLNIGLFYNDICVSVMSFSKYNYEQDKYPNSYELIRFCNNYEYQVYGSASKIIKYFMTIYKPNFLISYCDRRWSDGNTYLKCGFIKESVTAPNYWYWGGRKDSIYLASRKHRLFANKFVKKSGLLEKIIMTDLGYAWIYDCGNLKFVLKNIF